MGAGQVPIIVIEHCEDTLSPWILLEYRHVSQIFGKERVWFTNVNERYHRILFKYGTPYSESVVSMVLRGFIKAGEVAVLDPRSSERLTYNDLISYKYIVIGGILGDFPPRGRTYALITSRMPGVRAYNIGEGQYSIDGAAYYIYYMATHGGDQGFQYVDGVYIRHGDLEIRLPFRYPLVNGRPLLAEGLEYFLINRRLPEYIRREIFGDS